MVYRLVDLLVVEVVSGLPCVHGFPPPCPPPHQTTQPTDKRTCLPSLPEMPTPICASWIMATSFAPSPALCFWCSDGGTVHRVVVDSVGREGLRVHARDIERRDAPMERVMGLGLTPSFTSLWLGSGVWAHQFQPTRRRDRSPLPQPNRPTTQRNNKSTYAFKYIQHAIKKKTRTARSGASARG